MMLVIHLKLTTDIDANQDQYTGKPVPLDQKEQRPPEVNENNRIEANQRRTKLT